MKHTAKGFSLITVTVVLAIMSLGAVVLVDVVGLDLEITGEHRRNFEVEGDAEAAIMEMMTDRNMATNAPVFTTPDLTHRYAAPAGSAVRNDDTGRNYEGELRLIRVAPMLESSHAWSRALVYEVRATAENDQVVREAEVVAEIFRTIVVSPGTELPQMHAR